MCYLLSLPGSPQVGERVRGFPCGAGGSPRPRFWFTRYENSAQAGILRWGRVMRVANTVELKNKTNELLRQVMKGEAVIVTYRGKPAASITPLSEDDLEDFVLQHSPKVRRMVAEAEADRKAGRVIPLETYLARLRTG